MHLWEGLFRPREEATRAVGNADYSNGSSSSTPILAPATNLQVQSSQRQQYAWGIPTGATNGSRSSDDESNSNLQQSLHLDVARSASGSLPVHIPGARVLPYSRLRITSGSSPGQQMLAANASPGSEEVLAATGASGLALSSSQPHSQRLPTTPQAASNSNVAGHRRPPLPPSPRSRQASTAPAHSPAGAWLNPSCNTESNNISIAAGTSRVSGLAAGSSVLLGSRSQLQQLQQQCEQQQQQQRQVATLQQTLSSPSGPNLLSSSLLRPSPHLAAVASSEGHALAAAAGNPHHPNHDHAMQALIQHQQQQLLQLQQQQADQQHPGPNSGTYSNGAGPVLVSSMPDRAYSMLGGQLPQSPRILGHSRSFGRLSELGTSPGLVEASFMGLAARSQFSNANRGLRRSGSSSGAVDSRQCALQQQQQQAWTGSPAGRRVSREDTMPFGFDTLQDAAQPTLGVSSNGGSSSHVGKDTALAGVKSWSGSCHGTTSSSGVVRYHSVPVCQLRQLQSVQWPTIAAPERQQSAAEQQQQAGQQYAATDAAAVSTPAVLGRRSYSDVDNFVGSPAQPNRSFHCNHSSRSGFGSFSRSPSFGGYLTCLICLDHLTSQDFESGEAMQLECHCKGEVALRHRHCAEKWSRVKGSTICDVCKAPIMNLPDVPPLPPPPGQGFNAEVRGLAGPGTDQGLWGSEEPPAVADCVFDCIRVTWVVLIVCILFFEMSVSRSFMTGALIGSAYVAVAASWASAMRRRRHQGAAAAAAYWVAGRHPLQQHEQRLPLLHYEARAGLHV